MTGARPSDILRQLEGPIITDRDLLARYVRERDHSAFKELIARYGPIVLGVCRRVIGHPQDAEDAFQAVFLVLARKAPSIRNPEVIGSWLHGVALRVAQTARRSMLRRRSREIAVSVMPEQAAPTSESELELSPILDEELAGLPAWYRDAIVLCDLKGASREDAAAALGVPIGTLSSRLTNGRKKLAERLTKRGIAISAAAISTTFSASQAATVPVDLMAKTSSLVADWSAGVAIPRPLAKLSEGGFTVRKALILGLFTAVATLAGVVYAVQPEQIPITNEAQNPPSVASTTEPAENPAPETKLGEKSVVFTSKPKLLQTIDVECSGNLLIAWNAQGTQLAVQSIPGKGSQTHVEVISVDTLKKRVFHPGESNQLVGFTPDGKNIVTEIREYELVSGIHRLDFWREVERTVQRPGTSGGGLGDFGTIKSIIVEKLRSLNLDLSQTQGFSNIPYVFLPGGKAFRTISLAQDPATPGKINLDVMDVDIITGNTIKSLFKKSADSTGSQQTLSPNGKKLAVVEKRGTIVVYDVERATKTFSLEPETLIGKKRFPGLSPSTARNPANLNLNFSANGSHLVVSFGHGVCVAINADTGAQLPDLEGIETFLPGEMPAVFSGDGRLLALYGQQFTVVKRRIGKDEEEREILTNGMQALRVWDTQTGKALKTWHVSSRVNVAFNPVQPVLAVFERNRNGNTRIGFWSFAAETSEKK
jgi:RNA polymerase sigma factor (sigma-70 family)